MFCQSTGERLVQPGPAIVALSAANASVAVFLGHLPATSLVYSR
jgi:hypothetical protein